MAVHRDKSLSYDGPLREGRGWWVLAAQQFRTILGFRRTKLVIPLLWVAPLTAALLVIAEYVFRGQSGSVQPPGGTGVEIFLQMQFYSLAILYAVTSAQTVSHDLRYRTTQLYFSKPLERWEYTAGKLLGLVGIGSLVTVLPAAVVGALRTALYSQNDLTAAVGADAAVAVGLSLALTIVSACLVVGISSTTERTGFAVLAWLAVVVVPEVAAQIGSLTSDAGEYVGLMSAQGAIDALASRFVSGELGDLFAGLPVLSLAIWLAAGLLLHLWRLRNLDAGL